MTTQWLAVQDIRQRLPKLAAVGVILALSAYFGRSASPTALLLFLALLGGLVLLRQPALGLPALLIGALCIPFAIGTGTQTELHLGILLVPALLGTWVLDMIRRRAVRLVPSPANLPLFALALSVTVSLLAGNLTWNYFARQASLQSQIGGWAVFVLSVGIFLFLGNVVQDLRWLKLLVGIFLVLGAVVVGSLVLPLIGPLLPRLVVGAVIAESLFWVWLVAWAGGLAIFDTALHPSARMACLVLALVTLAYSWFLRRWWVSGWFPPLVVLIVLLWLRSWRLGLLITFLGVIGILLLKQDLVTSVISLKQYSTDSRFAAWDVLLSNVIPLSPIIGLGPSNYYFYTPLFPIWGYYVSFNSHNQYIDLVAQTGIVGLVIFGWVMIAIGRQGWDLRTRVEGGFAKGYVYACLAGLVGTVISGWFGDWVFPFVYNVGLAGFRASMLAWLFLGGLVAIDRIRPEAHPVQERSG